MQPKQPSQRRGLERRRVRRVIPTLIALAALLAGSVGLGVVRAQDDAGFEGVTIEVFGSGAPSAAAENQLTLRRITFEPGASLPPHSHPGAVTFSVASGELAYTLIEGEGTVQRAAVDGEVGAVEPLLAGAPTPLAVGDSVFVEGTIAQAGNQGSEPTVLWASSLLTADEPFLTEIAAEEADTDSDAEDADEPTAAAADEEPEESEESEEPEEAAVEGVRVSLDEFTIRLSSEIPAGETTFVITNRGSIYHNFLIVGEGVEAAVEAPLAPGDTAELTVDLPAGTYQIVCPVANHESLGMTRDLVVT